MSGRMICTAGLPAPWADGAVDKLDKVTDEEVVMFCNQWIK
jgi:hypothetical protein